MPGGAAGGPFTTPTRSSKINKDHQYSSSPGRGKSSPAASLSSSFTSSSSPAIRGLRRCASSGSAFPVSDSPTRSISSRSHRERIDVSPPSFRRDSVSSGKDLGNSLLRSQGHERQRVSRPLQQPQTSHLRPSSLVGSSNHLRRWMSDHHQSAKRQASASSNQAKVRRRGDPCKVTVAVRVRPMTSKDIQMAGRDVVVSMHGNSTVVFDPTAFAAASSLAENRGLDDAGHSINLAVWAKQFHFDHCYWSCDDEEGDNGHYADQIKVFLDLGQSMLDAAWQGLNCSLFAYGQTGSGKSYSMMGTGGTLDENLPRDQHGLIPRICSALFDKINSRLAQEGEDQDSLAVAEDDDDNHLAAAMSASTLECSVEVSYMEIYNESVYDLLSSDSQVTPPISSSGGGQTQTRQSLRVREYPQQGAYVDGLTVLSVDSYQEIEHLLGHGSAAKTVATTTMNNQSSRSHTIFTVIFRQSRVDQTKKVLTEKISKMHMVDLAGSERVYNTRAQGLRLKEATSINKSLATLADVIKALSELSSSSAAAGQHHHNKRGIPRQQQQRHIPYRNSILTWLLKESLGGNAKTFMLATISPADIHYNETISTLKYAEKVKKVNNYVVVNEASSSNEKMQRDLEAEVARLRAQLTRLSTAPLPSSSSLSPQQRSRGGGWKGGGYQSDGGCPPSPLDSAYSFGNPSTAAHTTSSKIALVGDEIDVNSPRLVNLNQDPLFSEALTYYLREGVTIIGSDADGCDIHLSGEQIRPHHCCITNSNGRLTIYPFADDCTAYLNGQLISTSEQSLARQPSESNADADGVALALHPTPLRHGSRLILGRHHYFRFDHDSLHSQMNGDEEEGIIDWDFAHREFLEANPHLLTPRSGSSTPQLQSPSSNPSHRRVANQQQQQSQWIQKAKTDAFTMPPSLVPPPKPPRRKRPTTTMTSSSNQGPCLSTDAEEPMERMKSRSRLRVAGVQVSPTTKGSVDGLVGANDDKETSIAAAVHERNDSHPFDSRNHETLISESEKVDWNEGGSRMQQLSPATAWGGPTKGEEGSLTIRQDNCPPSEHRPSKEEKGRLTSPLSLPLENRLSTALERAKKAEIERARVSQLLAARDKDIESLKKRIEAHRDQLLLQQQQRQHSYSRPTR